MSFDLSRKRKKQLKKLVKKADKLWAEQKVVADHAATIAREAKSQAKTYSRETLIPGAQDYANRTVNAGRDSLSRATRGWNAKVVPALIGGLGSIAALGQVGKDKSVQSALDSVRQFATVPEVRSAQRAPSGPSALQWMLIGAGAVAVVTAAYTAWQMLRADDDIWTPDSDEIDEPPRRPDTSGGVADGPEAGAPQE